MEIRSKIHLSGLLLFFITIMLFSCYEPIEDCLELRASNYSLIADNPCDDCCTFPNLNLLFTPLWQGEPLRTDTMYINTRGDTFAINQANFLVSNIVLRNDSTQLATMDSILLDCDVVYNSFSTTSLQSRIASSRSVPITFGFDQVEFEVGVSDCLAMANTLLFDNDDFESGSTFLDQQIIDQEYLSASFQLIRDIDTIFIQLPDTLLMQTQDTVNIAFTNSEFNEQYVLDAINGSFDVTQGSNFMIEVFVDYSVLFSTVLFDDDEENIKSAINQNLSSAFSLVE